jgi:hypothetical protein
MAKLFLSYSRKNARAAERLTHWLEGQGHDVWRDEDDIGGGTSFSSEIERALEDCDAVLVLWSTDSAQSAWVRDEAGYGRDKGKLIPLSLDGTEPPLGFRQFQSIDVSKWKGSGAPPAAERIKAAIARIAHLPRAAPSPKRPQRRSWTEGLMQRRLVIGALIGVAIPTAALVVWQRWSGDQEVAIAVVASPASPDRAMAADYANVAAADMAAFLPRRFDQATVVAPGDSGAQSSAYRIEISTDPHGAAADATLTLLDKDGHTTLWSRNWSVDDASAADLKAQVSTAASKAALCLTDAKGGARRLSQPALGLYLSGCSNLGGDKISIAEFEGMFERVTKLAPDFGRGWDYLALSRSWIAESLRDGSPSAYRPALQSARDAIAVARKLNPHSAMSYDAEFHLASNDTFRGLQLLEQGAKIDPGDGRVQMHLSDEYLAVGRLSDSVRAAERGVELEPGSSFTTYQYILAMAYSGRFSRAKDEIAAARKKWPNDFAINLADYTFQSHYGDAKAALQLLPKVEEKDADIDAGRKVIEARLDRSPAKTDAAIAATEARTSNDPRSRNPVLAVLARFGRTDQAFQLMEDPRFQPAIMPSLLFRPDFAEVRADRRFMGIAARLGLVRYWRESGYWPDFCSTEKLTYDCKAEAAKYPN